MKIERFHIYLADLVPSFGTEPGKTRPVVVIQTDLLNNIHHSTVICPLTTQVEDAFPLRVHIPAREFALLMDSDVIVDQVRAIDNRRFKKHLGKLNYRQSEILMECLQYLIFE